MVPSLLTKCKAFYHTLSSDCWFKLRQLMACFIMHAIFTRIADVCTIIGSFGAVSYSCIIGLDNFCLHDLYACCLKAERAVRSFNKINKLIAKSTDALLFLMIYAAEIRDRMRWRERWQRYVVLELLGLRYFMLSKPRIR